MGRTIRPTGQTVVSARSPPGSSRSAHTETCPLSGRNASVGSVAVGGFENVGDVGVEGPLVPGLVVLAGPVLGELVAAGHRELVTAEFGVQQVQADLAGEA